MNKQETKLNSLAETLDGVRELVFNQMVHTNKLERELLLLQTRVSHLEQQLRSGLAV